MKFLQRYRARYGASFSLERRDGLEMTLSILGVFLAMSVLIGLMYVLNDSAHPWLLMASMGASAIIVFATPHAPMAQPILIFESVYYLNQLSINHANLSDINSMFRDQWDTVFSLSR